MKKVIEVFIQIVFFIISFGLSIAIVYKLLDIDIVRSIFKIKIIYNIFTGLLVMTFFIIFNLLKSKLKNK